MNDDYSFLEKTTGVLYQCIEYNKASYYFYYNSSYCNINHLPIEDIKMFRVPTVVYVTAECLCPKNRYLLDEEEVYTLCIENWHKVKALISEHEKLQKEKLTNSCKLEIEDITRSKKISVVDKIYLDSSKEMRRKKDYMDLIDTPEWKEIDLENNRTLLI